MDSLTGYMQTALGDAALTSALAALAQISQQAAIDANTGDFGTTEQPELLVLQWWKQLRVPAAQMKAMNTCRMGDQANLSICFDADEKKDPEALLIFSCKAMNRGQGNEPRNRCSPQH